MTHSKPSYCILFASLLFAKSQAEPAYVVTHLAPTQNNQTAVVGTDDNLYVADNDAIVKISATGEKTVIAGTPGQQGSTNGPGSVALFKSAAGIAVDAENNIYVSEWFNHTIRKIDREYNVTTLAGAAGVTGSTDGDGTAARFYNPRGLTVDPNGNVYVADSGNHTIRKISPDGAVTTIAGQIGSAGSTDGAALSARFNTPLDVAINSVGEIFVLENVNHTIRKIDTNGTVSTFAGSAQQSGFSDGQGSAARFYYPNGFTIDKNDNLIVGDTGNATVRVVSPTGLVTTIAGSARMTGDIDGVAEEARFFGVFDVAIDSNGTLYLPDTNNKTIRKAVPTVSTITWPPPTHITYGDELSTIQYSPTANVAGSLVVTPGIDTLLNAGTYTLSATFTPEDTLHFESVTSSVTLTIEKATPTVTWNTPDSIPLGTPLSSVQLNATANVDGSFFYTPDSSTLLNIGSHQLSTTFTPLDATNYNSVISVVNLEVVAADLAGTYSGTFTSDTGWWAMTVDSKNAARLVAFLPDRTTALVGAFIINQNGSFTGSISQIVTSTTSSGTASLSHAISADESELTFSGNVGVDGVSADLPAMGLALTGSLDSSVSSSASGYYHSSALGTTNAETYTIVSGSGRVFLVLTSPGTIDGGIGTVDNQGQLSLSTNGSIQVQGALDTSASSIAVSMILPGESTPTAFSGLLPSVATTSRLVNISTLSLTGRGDRTFIMGFVLDGTESKPLLARGIGPGLIPYGITTGYLADPSLQLFNSEGNSAGNNEDWNVDPTVFQSVGAFPLEAGSLDAALQTELNAGPYTTHLLNTDPSAPDGTALIEIYDTDFSRDSRFTNISIRTQIEAGSRPLTAGFVIHGNAPKKLLIRGVGPALANYGIEPTTLLSDPLITVFQNGSSIAENDNWEGSESIITASAITGAFQFESADAKDAALVINLAPGAYTVQLSDPNGTGGIGLLEIYEIP